MMAGHALTTVLTFVGFTLFVAIYSWYKIRKENLSSRDGYFLGGRSLTGVVIAGSMLLTNISTEHLIGMNGSAYKNGMIIIAWEVTSALALVIAAYYFIPVYLRKGLTTIPQYLEERYDGFTRTMVAFFLLISFVVTLLPIVLYTGAINLESIFDVSGNLGLTKTEGLWYTVLVVGVIGGAYAVFGGLKAVAVSDTVNGVGLLIGGLLIPFIALYQIGDGHIFGGLKKVYEFAPEKFNVIGAKDSVLPFSTLFTGLMINQLYFWGMNQSIVQRALGAKSLKEAQKGLLFTGVLKILIPIVIVLPGLIAYYYFKDTYYDQQDNIYPILIKKLLPVALLGFFAAVVMGAVLSTFNSVLNSAATIFCVGIYKRLINKEAPDSKLVRIGKLTSLVMAVVAICVAPFVANAPEGLYQMMQQLNGIFFIPVASILLAGLFIPQISAQGAKSGLLFGLGFYILTVFILKVNIHFVHIWGIEFVLNMAVMWLVSRIYPRNLADTEETLENFVPMEPWKYTRPMSIVLIAVILLIYIILGT